MKCSPLSTPCSNGKEKPARTFPPAGYGRCSPGNWQQTRRMLAARRIPTLTIRYRDCVDRPPEVAASMAFLGGPLDEPAMVAAIDPRLYRHRGVPPK